MTVTVHEVESGASLYGPYRVVERIATGGMGVVFRAEDTRSHARVALKTVTLPDNRMLAHLRREIHALAQLQHPGVIRILDHGVVEGRPWYAMDFVDGETLRVGMLRGRQTDGSPTVSLASSDLITKPAGPLANAARGSWRSWPTAAVDPELVRGLLVHVRCLCDALAYLHGEGVVHRDLKPENVMIVDGTRPVLVDFGLAARTTAGPARDRLESLAGVVGTAEYMAPEQIRGEIVDARADLYALGVLLFEIVTNRLPFEADSQLATMRMHLHEPPPRPGDLAVVDAKLEKLILQLLAKHPRDRLGNAGEVAAALDDAGVRASWDGAIPRPRSYLFRPEFVGRRDALAVLDRELAAALTGECRIALIGGESGAGKTRLAMELAHRADVKDALVIVGQCAPAAPRDGAMGPGAPLEPLRELLEAVADRCHDYGPDETLRLLPNRAKILAPFAPALRDVPGFDAELEPDPLDGRAARERVLRAMCATISRLADIQPLVLVLDDLQWADDLTLAVVSALGGVSGRPARSSVLVVATYRRDEVSATLGAVLKAMPAARIDLQQLATSEARELVAGMLGGSALVDSRVCELADQAEGNPFFLAEILHGALADGALRRSGVEWRTTGLGASGGPSGLRQLIEHRLGQLAPDVRRVLEVAAVIGRELDWELLALAGLGESELLRAVNVLLNQHFVEEVTGGGLRFAHDKLREVTYQQLDDARRLALHADAAAALEHRAATAIAPELLDPALARHFTAAGAHARAWPYLERAGDRALLAGGHRDAIALFGQALATSTGVPPLDRARWHRKLGDAHFAIGELDAAGRHATTALELLGFARPATSATITLDLLHNAARHLGGRLGLRPRPRARDDRARHAEAALAAQRLAERHYYAYASVPMMSTSLLAVELAERAGEFPKVARTYAMLALVFGMARLGGAARSYFDRALAMARTGDDPYGELFATYARMAMACGAADWSIVEEAGPRAVALGERLGDRYEQAIVETLLGHSEFYRGELTASVRRYQTLAERARGTGNQQHEAWGLYAEARALLALGRCDDVTGLVERARVLLADQTDVASEVICAGLLASAHAERGEWELAEAEAASVRARTRGLPVVFSTLHGYAGAAETYLALWSRARADKSARADELGVAARGTTRALEVFALAFAIGRPLALLARGERARITGNLRAARRAWRQAIEAATDLAMPYEAARAHAALAGIAAPGSTDRRAHLTAARRGFEALGCWSRAADQPKD